MPLFENVRFFCASCLMPEEAARLSKLLISNKATQAPLHEATHIISNTSDFEGSEGVIGDAYVVTERWVHRSTVLGKVLPEANYSPDQDKLFSGVIACATELLPQDVEVLSAGIQALGGTWRTGLTRDVTHLFALSAESEKYKVAMHFQAQTNVAVIVPKWFDDTLRLGYRDLATEPYAWPKPSVLQAGRAREGIPGAITPQEMRALYKLTAEKKKMYEHLLESWVPEVTVEVWEKRRILLSPDLEMSAERLEAVEASIERSGGKVVRWESDFDDVDVSQYDILIARYRWGKVFIQAVRENKLVGSLSWLFYVQATGAIVAPTDQLLHFPIPPKPIENFDKHEITITNYTGPSRDYIKKLIEIMGARFTASMSGKNTAVIAGFIAGTKTEKAKNWNIPVLNHTWIEDCFVQWRALQPANGKYLRFPAGLDFARTLGTRGIGRRTVLENVQDIESEMSQAERMDQGIAAHAATAVPDIEQIVKATPRKGRNRRHAGDTGSGEEGAGASAGDRMSERRENSRTPSRPLPLPRPKSREKAHTELKRNTESSTPVAGPSTKRRVPRSTAPIDISSGNEDEARIDAEDGTPKHREHRSKEKATPRRTVSVVLPPEGTGPALSSQHVMETKSRSPRKDASSPALPRRSGTIVMNSTDNEEILAGSSQPIRNRMVVDVPSSSQLAALAKKSARLLQQLESESESESPLARVPARATNKVADTKGTARIKDKAAAVDENEPTPAHRSKKIAMKGKAPLRSRAPRGDDDEEESPPPPAPTRGKKTASTSKNKRSLPDEEESESTRPAKKSIQGHARQTEDAQPAKTRDTSSKNKQANSNASTRRTAAGKNHDPAAVGDDAEDPDANTSIASRAMKRRRSSGAVNADEPAPDTTERSSKKRRISANKPAVNNAASGAAQRAADTKKKRTNPRLNEGEGSPSQEVRLMTTGLTLSEDISKKLVKLGVKMVSNIKDCTHLVVNRIVRTEKFLCAIALAPIVANERWTKACALQKKLVVADDNYRLVDKPIETKYAFTLADALRRAKENKGRLFANMLFHITPRVDIDAKLLKAVVLAHGGKVKPGIPTVRSLQGKENVYVISCDKDENIWRPFVQAGHSIYTPEIVLTSALVQEIRLQDVSVVLANPA